MKLTYIKPLDGLRTIAILLVLIWHYFNNQVEDHLFNGTITKITSITSLSWSGVDLFFVLSGFLIGRILIAHKASTNYFKVFYLKRFLRIFPPYYLVLIVYYLLILFNYSGRFPWLLTDEYPWYTYFLYIQNFWIADSGFGPNWLGVTWSLAVEEQFYLVVPFIIYFLNKKFIPYFAILLIILAPYIRGEYGESAAYVLLPGRMDALLMGVLIAYCHLNGMIDQYLKPRKKLMIVLFIMVGCITFYADELGLNANTGTRFIHSLFTLLYGLLIVLVLIANNHGFFIKMLSGKIMVFMAKISYMTYLTHQIFSGLLHGYFLNQHPKIGNVKDLQITLLALLATIAFSTMSYYLFEKPLLSFGKKLKYTIRSGN